MKIRKNRPEPLIDRKIPQADLKDFEAPEIVKVQQIKNSDMVMIRSLSKELKVTGVIDRESARVNPDQTLIDIVELFSEAEEHQTYEKHITPELYSKETDEFLENREITEGDLFDNPSLDGIDDYGSQVYDEFVQTEEKATTRSNVRKDVIHEVEKDFGNHSKSAAIRMPDGTIIYGELL